MGAHFHHPCLSGTWEEFDAFRQRRGFSVWAADADGEVVDGLESPSRLALLVGNEGGDYRPTRGLVRIVSSRCRSLLRLNRSMSPLRLESFSTSSAK